MKIKRKKICKIEVMPKLTTQSITFIGLAALALFINLLVTSFMFGVYGFFAYIVILIILAPFIVLNIYNINCLSVGKCERWAWINSILSILYMFYITFILIMIASAKI